MDTVTGNAGAKALDEIKASILELLELLDNGQEEEVAEALKNFSGKITGSYEFSGADGWLEALNEPLAKPFNAQNWR